MMSLDNLMILFIASIWAAWFSYKWYKAADHRNMLIAAMRQHIFNLDRAQLESLFFRQELYRHLSVEQAQEMEARFRERIKEFYAQQELCPFVNNEEENE